MSNGDKSRILVVDDNLTNLKLACDVLEWAGYEVAAARDAEEAVEIIAQSPPALILMDIGLPGMDGLTLTRQLKAAEATRQIRVIALTAFAMKGDEERIREGGCEAYLSKPISVGKFIETVRRFIG